MISEAEKVTLPYKIVVGDYVVWLGNTESLYNQDGITFGMLQIETFYCNLKIHYPVRHLGGRIAIL